MNEKISLLPNQPGVYRFYDKNGTVIYVGKAKDLKKRVSSYFTSKSGAGSKLMALVRNICDIQYIVVENESDAFLLENNLIKELQPRYNILLKDDKTYPWIVVKKEQFPRIMQTRKVVKDGSLYFGPYSSVTLQKSILDLVCRLYSIRRCNLALTTDGVKKGKFDLCLNYHIGNCDAPCVGYISQEDYSDRVKMATNILRGNISAAYSYLKDQMMIEAEALRFEKAQQYKDRIALLDGYKSRSVVISSSTQSMDVFSIIVDENDVVYCNYMYVNSGAIINSYSTELKLGIDQSAEEVLPYAMSAIYERLERKPSKTIVTPFDINGDLFDNAEIIVPERGDKLRLLELSEKNSRIYRLERLKHIEKVDPDKHVNRIMRQMKEMLMLDKEPRHIECFDNSNIQGHNPVSSCVVFRNGKPSKREYRHFNIKTVVGIDDFASMEETITRRYSRIISEGGDLPDLIVVDGGKGQLSSAYAVLKELGIEQKVPIIGLAKRLEEVFYPSDPDPLYLDRNSDTLKVLMNIRNEAHRFGITFHRNKRSAAFINSELEKIPTLGKMSITKLLRKFGSVKKIKEASFESLSEVVGNARALKIVEYFNNKQKDDKE